MRERILSVKTADETRIRELIKAYDDSEILRLRGKGEYHEEVCRRLSFKTGAIVDKVYYPKIVEKVVYTTQPDESLMFVINGQELNPMIEKMFQTNGITYKYVTVNYL